MKLNSEFETTCPCCQATLVIDLNLRGITGATVLAITRADEGSLVPTATEKLRPGDVLALAGTREAVEAARRLLLRPRELESVAQGA